MMHRETLQTLKRAARKMDHHPSTQTEHALIDHGLEALDLIDGGTTADNRITEVRKGLNAVRVLLATIQDAIPVDLEPAVVDGGPLVDDLAKAVYVLDLISTEMLGTDYRRYSSWADQLPRIEEEFGE